MIPWEEAQGYQDVDQAAAVPVAPQGGGIPGYEGYDLGQRLSGLGKGAIKGATAGLYDPGQMTPEEEVGAGPGDFAGTSLVNALPWLLGPEAGIPFNALYGATREYAREGGRTPSNPDGKYIDELNEGAIVSQGLLGGATGAIPGAIGKTVMGRLVTGAGIGGITGGVGNVVQQQADTGNFDPFDPSFGQSIGFGAATGGAMGGGIAHLEGNPFMAEKNVSASIAGQEPSLRQQREASMGKAETAQPQSNPQMDELIKEFQQAAALYGPESAEAQTLLYKLHQAGFPGAQNGPDPYRESFQPGQNQDNVYGPIRGQQSFPPIEGTPQLTGGVQYKQIETNPQNAALPDGRIIQSGDPAYQASPVQQQPQDPNNPMSYQVGQPLLDPQTEVLMQQYRNQPLQGQIEQTQGQPPYQDNIDPQAYQTGQPLVDPETQALMDQYRFQEMVQNRENQMTQQEMLRQQAEAQAQQQQGPPQLEDSRQNFLMGRDQIQQAASDQQRMQAQAAGQANNELTSLVQMVSTIYDAGEKAAVLGRIQQLRGQIQIDTPQTQAADAILQQHGLADPQVQSPLR